MGTGVKIRFSEEKENTTGKPTFLRSWELIDLTQPINVQPNLEAFSAHTMVVSAPATKGQVKEKMLAKLH